VAVAVVTTVVATLTISVTSVGTTLATPVTLAATLADLPLLSVAIIINPEKRSNNPLFRQLHHRHRLPIQQ